MRAISSVLVYFMTFFGALMGFTVPATAFTMAGCGQNCTDCHSLTKEEAGKLIKADLFKALVTEVKMSPVKGLWQVEGLKDGHWFVVFVDFGKKYLVEAQITPLENLGTPPESKKVDPAAIPLSGSVLVGNPKAKNTVIVFSDPDCPYCRKLHQGILEMVKKRDDVAFYIKLYPLDIHPESYEKSRTILCEKSVNLLNDAFEGKDLPKSQCDAKELDENIALAKSLGFSGTPTLILPDGRVVPGYVDSETLLKMIDGK